VARAVVAGIVDGLGVGVREERMAGAGRSMHWSDCQQGMNVWGMGLVQGCCWQSNSRLK
jgi:hypothetical protein